MSVRWTGSRVGLDVVPGGPAAGRVVALATVDLVVIPAEPGGLQVDGVAHGHAVRAPAAA